jgi:hypothetical protein
LYKKNNLTKLHGNIPSDWITALEECGEKNKIQKLKKIKMAENIELNTGVLTLMTEGHLFGDDNNDSRIPHFPQSTFYVAPVSLFSDLPDDAKLYGKPNEVGRVKSGKDYVRVDNSPPRHNLKSSKYPKTKKITFSGVSADATLVTYGGNSGITIGVGYDIGAGRRSKKDIEDIFGTKMELNSKMVKTLQQACGHICIDAAHALGDNDMRNTVRLTQQQVCTLLNHAWPSYQKKAEGKYGMPLSFKKLYPPLQEVISKICYGYGSVPKKFRAKYDAPLSKISDHKEQCIYLKEALDAYGISSSDKFGRYIDKIHSVLKGGGKVIMSSEPIKMSELLSEDNPTLDWVGKVGGYPETGKRSLRGRMTNAKTEETAKMKEVFEKIGEKYVEPLSGDNVDTENNNTDNNNSENNEEETTGDKVIAEATVVSSTLNIRKGPGTDFDKDGKLKNGEVVKVYESKDNWHRIGKDKWICEKLGDSVFLEMKDSPGSDENTSQQEPVEEHNAEFIKYLNDLKDRIHEWFAEIEAMQICHQDEEKYHSLLKKIQNILQES